ncbi:unnamed protein product [Rhodiola kirilowii]
MMEWEKQPRHNGDARIVGEGDGVGVGGLMMMQQPQQEQQLVGMTDEQVEMLRKQIVVYSILCEKLVETHRSLSSQRDRDGVRIGSAYCDPLLMNCSHKISARQRWAPTPAQLRILENIFDQGNGTPSKQKIKDITTELSHHGPVSETNVYNWFQNRRARAKRKQTVPAANNNDTSGSKEFDSSKDKKAKDEEDYQSHQISTSLNDDGCYKSSAMSSELHSFDPLSSKAETMFSSQDEFKPSATLGDISFYESILSNRGVDQLTGRVVEGDYHPYHQAEDYNLMG